MDRYTPVNWVNVTNAYPACKPITLCVATMVFVGVTSDHQWSADTHMIIRHHLWPPPQTFTMIQINTNYKFTYPAYLHYISCSYCLGNIHCFRHALLLLSNYFGLCKGNWGYHWAQSCIHSHWCSNCTCSSNSAGISKHTCSSGDYHACNNSSHACSNNLHMRQY